MNLTWLLWLWPEYTPEYAYINSKFFSNHDTGGGIEDHM